MKTLYRFITRKPFVTPSVLGIIGVCFIVWFTNKLNHEVKIFAAHQSAEQYVDLILSIKSIIEEDKLNTLETFSQKKYSKELANQLIQQIQKYLNESEHPITVSIHQEKPDKFSLDHDINNAYSILTSNPKAVFTVVSNFNNERIYRYAVNINADGLPVTMLEVRIPLDKLEQHSQQYLIQLIVALSILGTVVLFILYMTLKGMRWQQRQQTKELEHKVRARTQSLAEQNKQLEDTMNTLQEAQEQLVVQEKMASIGVLTAGIAHEIKNPLNFINNFSDMNAEMLDELKEEILQLKNVPDENKEIIEGIIEDIEINCQKVNEHGKRAESTVKNMLLQSRNSDDQAELTDINKLVEEYLNLAYHGMRAQDVNFNVKMVKELDNALPQLTISQQNIGRVILNIINNALYAAYEKKAKIADLPESFMPTVTVWTKFDNEYVYIGIRDNGIGISEEGQKKVFEPFYTTKPAGLGTGLGLPICHDIVVEDHNGDLKLESKLNEWTEFTIVLPLDS